MPSRAIVLRAQSSRPEYVPVGADCILDLRTYSSLEPLGWRDRKMVRYARQGG